MSASRRDFLTSLAAAGLMASTPRLGYGLHSGMHPLAAAPQHQGKAELRIGYASIAWGGNDAQAIQDISQVGFPGIQLRANVVTSFPDPHALRDLLAEHKLTFVALSSGDATRDPAARQSIIEKHAKNAQYLKEAGGHYLQVIGSFDKTQAYTPADYKFEAQVLTEVGQRAAEYGIQVGFHNHMNSIGQAPQAVDAILAASDPKYVKLELDTAHYVQGGGDPAAAIRKYGDRLLFLHLKDVKSNSSASGYEFTELGAGRVDFPAIFSALNDIHFRGWGIVELDGERPSNTRTPTQSAEISKGYLEKTLGLNV